MLQLNILLRKLYRHKSDLEFMISIGAGPDAVSFTDQFNACLDNIRRYELLQKQFTVYPPASATKAEIPAEDGKD